jgi:hypothetical protein
LCKSKILLILAIPAAIVAAPPVQASFHLMQINQVLGSYYGDPRVQAIELRMRVSGEESVSQGRISAYDATGQNPVLIIDFDSDVAIGSAASRVLVTSPNLSLHTHPVTAGDFTMTNLIPASYLPAGSLTYESDAGVVLWRFSWGGAAYTGSNSGSTSNDADGNFGPPVPQSLTCNGAGSFILRCPSPATCHTSSSTNNAADYLINSTNVTFRNNAGTDFFLVSLVSVGDCNCDNVVDTDDIDAFVLALLDSNAYVASHPCCDPTSADVDLNGIRDGRDVMAFVDLLLNPK